MWEFWRQFLWGRSSDVQTCCFSREGEIKGESGGFFPNWLPLFSCYLSVCIPLFPGHLQFMAREATYCLVGVERYKPFALKCPWLEDIRSCTSPAGCNCSNCLVLFHLLASVSPFLTFLTPLAQEFSWLLTILSQ